MTPIFDLEAPAAVEFGVGRDSGSTRDFFHVSTNDAVDAVLIEMVRDTFRQMERSEGPPQRYDPADTPASQAYLQLPLDDDLAGPLWDLFHTDNFEYDNAFPSDLADVFCYFARFTDGNFDRFLCLRRATQFKTVRKRLLRFGSDALEVMPSRVYQLNNDFDLIVDQTTVHIIHPEGFRVLAQIDLASEEAVTENIKAIRDVCPYVEWSSIEEYAMGKPRVARLLASIRSADHAKSVSKTRLAAACARVDVPLVDGDQITVPEPSIKGFLEVLNRRRFESDLVPSEREVYWASNRQRVSS